MYGSLTDLQPEEAAMGEGLLAIATQFKGVDIGPVRIHASGWILSKPEPGDSSLYFGQVKRIIQHEGPDGVTHIFLDAKWHQADLDAKLRVPIVKCKAKKPECGPIWPVSKVVPLHCWAAPMHGDSHRTQDDACTLMAVCAAHPRLEPQSMSVHAHCACMCFVVSRAGAAAVWGNALPGVQCIVEDWIMLT
jgi:hypothetical protein